MSEGNLITKKLRVKNPTKEMNTLEVTMYYSLGGMNYFTYGNEPRGYYISVTPVLIEDKGDYSMRTYVGFTGTKVILKEVKRKNKKAEQEARELFEKSWKNLVYNCFPNVEYEE